MYCQVFLLVFLGSLLCIAVTTWMFDQHPTSFWPSPHFMSLAEPFCADTLQRPSFYPPIGPPFRTSSRPSSYKEFPISTQVRYWETHTDHFMAPRGLNWTSTETCSARCKTFKNRVYVSLQNVIEYCGFDDFVSLVDFVYLVLLLSLFCSL